MAYLEQASARMEATQHVHSGVERFAVADERLQTAAYDRVFLQHGDFPTVFGQQRSGK